MNFSEQNLCQNCDQLLEKQNSIKEDILSENECPICLNNITTEELVRLQCNHCICSTCLSGLILYTNICPFGYCKKEFISYFIEATGESILIREDQIHEIYRKRTEEAGKGIPYLLILESFDYFTREYFSSELTRYEKMIELLERQLLRHRNSNGSK